jgi:hypothetical protein
MGNPLKEMKRMDVLTDNCWVGYKIKLNEIDWQQGRSDIEKKVIRKENCVYGDTLQK